MIEAEPLTAREKETYDATGIIVWNYKSFYLVRERDHALLAGPFESREKALDYVPAIQAQEPRLAEARRFDLADFWAGANGWYIGKREELEEAVRRGSPPPGTGPFTSWFEALDAIPAAIQQQIRIQERLRQERIEERLGRANLPARHRGRTLEDVKQPGIGEMAAAFIAYLRADSACRAGMVDGPFDRPNCLVLCGLTSSGKTRLACIIAEAFARADYEIRYATATDAISAQHGSPELMSELRSADLLVLDWSFDSDIVAALAAPHITAMLKARFAQSRPVLLIADCKLQDLQRYLGQWAFEELQKRTWRVLEMKVPKHKRTTRRRRVHHG